jgi:hypothetical protein
MSGVSNFSSAITDRFCEENKLELIVRGSGFPMEGFEVYLFVGF